MLLPRRVVAGAVVSVLVLVFALLLLGLRALPVSEPAALLLLGHALPRVVVFTATSPHALRAGCQARSVEITATAPADRALWEAHVTSASATRAVCVPPPRTFDLQRVGLAYDLIVFTSIDHDSKGGNALMVSAFDPRFASWARDRHDDATERAIDDSCAERRKSAAEAPGREQISESESEAPPFCWTEEIGILRAALLFTRILSEARSRSDGIRVEPVAPLPEDANHIHSRLERFAHRALVGQICDLGKSRQHSFWITPRPQLYPIAPKNKQWVDAGYCETFPRAAKEENPRGPVAICLPTLLIVGAQKAATDEVSVWLNRNPFHRRLDGGMEIHFFDCVGRGRAGARFNCRKIRSDAMLEYSAGSFAKVKNLAVAANATEIPPTTLLPPKSTFSWFLERKKSPYVDDAVIWRSYLRLGHLTAPMFRVPSGSRTLLYDKSASYVDLANPQDVVRILPTAKLLFISRDPVPRLLSAYYQFCSVPQNNRAGNCSMDNFEQLVREFASGSPSRRTPARPAHEHNNADVKRLNFQRALDNGMYAGILEKWMRTFTSTSRGKEHHLLVVDQYHFLKAPRAVLYAIESFIGDHGARHYDYHPHFIPESGMWALGSYSKANHPTHVQGMSGETEAMLRAYYRQNMVAFRALLVDNQDHILMGCSADDRFPESVKQQQGSGSAALFATPSRFALPPWLMDF